MPIPATRTNFARLLMVDDNSLGLQARKAVLEELGHCVTAAGSVEDAMELLVAGPSFDIVITDYKLPGMTGSDLIHEILKRKLPVHTVLLSGFVDALGLNEANTGADVVLQKSSQELSHLVRSVKALLRKRKPAGTEPGPADMERKRA